MSVKPTSTEIRLREQIQELRQERIGIDIAIGKLEAVLDGLGAPGAAQVLPPASMRQQILQNMELILREKGPMHRERLKAVLEDRGLHVNTIQTLANYLSKDERFNTVKKGNGIWELKDEDNIQLNPHKIFISPEIKRQWAEREDKQS